VSNQEQEKVAMVVVAHADDAEFAAAGTVALWAREGWDVYYIVCTDGGSGGPDEATDVSFAARQEVIETRKKEQQAAAKVLGVKDVLFLGYPDGQLQPDLALRRQIVRLLRRYRPTRVIFQSPDRAWTPVLRVGAYHPDHMAAGQATLAAIYPASQNPCDFPELFEEEGLKPHKVSDLYIMASPAVNYGVDITSTIETKLEALRAHESQVGNHIADLERMLRSWSEETGKRHGYTYAEEFHRVENR
jgi:LmbE family N-acetylglucosaminyl deacetylase